MTWLKGDPRLKSKSIYERTSPFFPSGRFLREVTRHWLPRTTVRALRTMLRDLYDGQAERPAPVPTFQGSVGKAQVLAVARDLQFLAEFLSLSAFEALDDNQEDPEVVQLQDRLALHLARVAETLEGSIRGGGRELARQKWFLTED